MALSYTAATDTCNVGSAASLDNLNTLTYLAWLYPTSALSSGGVLTKGTAAGGNRRSLEIRTSVVSNGLFGVVDAGTTDAQAEANVLVADAWQCVGMTYDDATKTIALYWGDRATLLAVPTYSTSPVTAVGSTGDNSANNQFLGSNGTGTSGGAGKRIGAIAIFNRVLSLGEMRAWQARPRVLSGCVGFWRLGWNGTGTQVDWSGTGNAGTLTGTAVAADPPLGPAFGYDDQSGLYTVAAAASGPHQPVNAGLVNRGLVHAGLAA